MRPGAREESEWVTRSTSDELEHLRSPSVSAQQSRHRHPASRSPRNLNPTRIRAPISRTNRNRIPRRIADPNLDPTPPPAGETPPPGENNQQQNNNTNTQTTPSGGEVRTAEPGEVLNTGGYQEEEKKPEEKTPEPSTPPPPPPPPVVYVPPTPPVVIAPKDQVIPQVIILDKEKSKDSQLQQESEGKLKTTLNPELPQNNIEENNGAQLQRINSLDENAEAFDTNGVMTMFSTNENNNEQVQTMAAAAAPVARPSLVSVFTGFLALSGLGPSTGAGTPSFPFVPTPIFDAIFAFVRRIESTLSNQTPTANVNSAWNPTHRSVGWTGRRRRRRRRHADVYRLAAAPARRRRAGFQDRQIHIYPRRSR